MTEYNLVTNIEQCFFLVRDYVPVNLVYYSHIPAALLALLVGFFVFLKSARSLVSKILLGIAIVFSLWAGFDIILWTSYDSQMYMFFWNFMMLFEALFFILSLYFVYVFIDKKDVSYKIKVIWGILLLPILVAMNTTLYLQYFSIVDCVPIEGSFYQFYALPLYGFIFLWMLCVSVHRYIKATNHFKKQIIHITTGVTFLLLLFLLGETLANYFIDNGALSPTEGYAFEFYGLFGMPIFMGFLAYLIVRYKAFDIKLIGAQALVVTQFLFIASILTVVTSLVNYILVSITLIITLVAGWILIRSVKNEIEHKEQLQKLSESLAVANDRLRELDMAKSEFISIASHQLRTPLTAIKGYLSLILEGSYGKVPVAIQDVLDKMYTINSRLVQLVEDLLNISRIEAGRIQYTFAPTQLEPLVAELVDMFALAAKTKKLALDIRLPKVGLPKLMLDAGKIKEVVSNLIDNALKYTKEGGVTVSVEGNDKVVRIIVADTGIGIHPEDKDKLFEKFSRSNETTKMVVSGTGLGLFVGKNFIAAHGGHIHVESAGPGKGSQFIIELPLVNPKIQAGTSDQASFSGLGKK